jgi:8-oxo-dGTP diphosphatase
MTTTSALVRAAGVVLLRDGEAGREVLLVHRPHRQDWSLPKGKRDPGEHVVAAAVRECIEESGIIPALRVPLPQQSYVTSSAAKTVDYWRADIGRDTGFRPTREVDDRRWVPVSRMSGLATYDRDIDLVTHAAALPVTVPFILLRHTTATKRVDFGGPDDQLRPLLSPQGFEEAEALVPLLAAYGISQVHSSDSVRCRQTVRAFSAAASVDVVTEPLLSEEGHERSSMASVERMRELLRVPAPVVVCSHRPVMPAWVRTIGELEGSPEDLSPRLQPGAFLVIHRTWTGGVVTVSAVERHDMGRVGLV